LQHTRLEAGAAVEAIENKLAGELSKAQDMAQVGMAASALVHDLRNPLTSLMAYVEVLDHELRTLENGVAPGLTNASHALIDKINLNLRRCRELTTTWRSITDEKSMQPDAFDLNLLMGELAADPPVDARQQSRKLILHGPALPLQIVADRSQIRRVLLNLLLNAVQATDPERGEIILHWEACAGTVRIRVSDNGVGIPPAVREHIWEPYFTHRSPGGTGLGLFIVKRIVDLHHGTLEMDSTPGAGTTFTISLPLADPASWSRLYP